MNRQRYEQEHPSYEDDEQLELSNLNIHDVRLVNSNKKPKESYSTAKKTPQGN